MLRISNMPVVTAMDSLSRLSHGSRVGPLAVIRPWIGLTIASGSDGGVCVGSRNWQNSRPSSPQAGIAA